MAISGGVDDRPRDHVQYLYSFGLGWQDIGTSFAWRNRGNLESLLWWDYLIRGGVKIALTKSRQNLVLTFSLSKMNFTVTFSPYKEIHGTWAKFKQPEYFDPL